MGTLRALWTPTNGSDKLFHATASYSPNNPAHALVESFVTGDFHIIVELDAIPIRSFAVVVSILPDSLAAPPDRIHFGQSFSSPHQWDHPQDLHFCPDVQHQHAVSHTLDNQPNGLSFVICLTDGTWLRDHDGADFHVGAAGATLPSVVELPLPWPRGIKPARSLSLYRMNPFWLLPHWTDTSENPRDETFFLLSELSKPPSSFAAILFAVDEKSDIRTSRVSYGVRLESGLCSSLSAQAVHGSSLAFLAVASNPFDAARDVVSLASHNVSFCSRVDKVADARWADFCTEPRGLLSSLGYCTWDAFAWQVHEKDVGEVVDWLLAAGVKIGYVIVDDGWQSGGADGPYVDQSQEDGTLTDRPTLTSMDANEKFSGSLRSLSENHDVNIFAWIAAIGYWGGVSGKNCGLRTVPVKAVHPRGLFRNKVDNHQYWLNTFEMLHPESQVLFDFYDKYFVKSMMLKQGVFAAKVDAQGIIGTLCNVEEPNALGTGKVTRLSIVKEYRNALTAGAEKAFPTGAIINCMACDPELIFSSGTRLSSTNICWRTSNDHAFPNIEETAQVVAWHIICNAMNTIALGEIFPAPDWDMFRAFDHYAHLHTAARVLSGGPIYISDKPFTETGPTSKAIKLLQSLTTSDGKIVRCKEVGRATADSLFQDPRGSPARLFKIFNTNTILGIIGLFNLALDVPNAVEIRGSFAPSDVADFARLSTTIQFISLTIGESQRLAHFHESKHDRCEVTVPLMGAVLAHICPVVDVAPQVQVAMLGQPRLMNCGGSLVSRISCTEKESTKITFLLADHGETIFWVGEKSIPSLLNVSGTDGSLLQYRPLEVGSMKLMSVTVPDIVPYSVSLRFKAGESC